MLVVKKPINQNSHGWLIVFQFDYIMFISHNVIIGLYRWQQILESNLCKIVISCSVSLTMTFYKVDYIIGNIVSCVVKNYIKYWLTNIIAILKLVMLYNNSIVTIKL